MTDGNMDPLGGNIRLSRNMSEDSTNSNCDINNYESPFTKATK